ncbi:MAG: acyl carrier protein [Lachnospiraceae bacterium]|nr:acyl carrier protein [Lachnospiraceae bacterium]
MEELLEILSELHEDVDFMNCEKLFDDKIIDSFDIVAIIAEIYDRFDVTISAGDIIPQNFNSAKSLWILVEKLMDEN